MINDISVGTEADRLAVLHALQILDTDPEPEFDALVQAAALGCDAPVALLCLVDQDRPWFKARHGGGEGACTARTEALCAEALRAPGGWLEVTDAASDPRHFAAVPLVTDGGARLGLLCVQGDQPRRLDARQQGLLTQLAHVALRALHARWKALDLAQRQQRLYEQTPALLLALDPDGRLQAVSDGWLQHLGLRRVDVLGQALQAYLAAPAPAWLANGGLARLFSGERCEQLPLQMRHAQGQVLDMRLSAVLDRDVTGRPLRCLCILSDVSERLVAEHRLAEQTRALRQSEDFLRRTGRLAGVGGWQLDLPSQALHWSDEICHIHGVPAGYLPTLDEAIGFYAPEAQPVVRAAVEQAMAGQGGWDLELPLVDRQGRRRWVRAVGQAEFDAGRATRLVGVLQDVTQRVQERLGIQGMHERIALAADSGGIGIWEHDLALQAIVWDERMHQLFGGHTEGLRPDEVWAQRVLVEDQASVEAAVHAALASGQPYDIEFRLLWPDGSEHHLRASARVLRDADGRPLRMMGATWDVTAQRRLATELQAQHELLRVTLKSIGDAVITTDDQGRITWLNPVAERMTGWSVAQAQGLLLGQVFHIVHRDTRQATENPVAVCLREQRIVGLAQHTVLISRTGAQHDIEDSAAPIRNEHGEVLGAVLVFHDVTEQRRLSGEMKYRATHDPVTGLLNRAAFDQRLRSALADAREQQSQHSLVYIDLDQFKLVNDACGHSVGDQLLRQVGQQLQAVVRTRDTLARLGGDEFAVILDHCAPEQAQRVAQQICERLDDFRFEHDQRRLRVGASIGLVPVDERWHDTEAILQAADAACYAAKEAGRNRVHTWYDTDLAIRRVHGDAQWARRVEHALDNDGLRLMAQRILALEPGAAALHAEVLLRMVGEGGELIAPGAFLHVAERFHLASRIDRWVLRRALAWMAALPADLPLRTLAVNLSGQSVGDRSFHRDAMALLQAAGAAVCQRLCLEITETAAITNLADATTFITQVRALGVRIALDDFGAGASSFGYLKTLPVDLIKIDGQFVRDMVEDRLDDAAVRCFADVARVMGVPTVAEFVDRPEVLARLREVGVDFAQGYLLHKPQPLDALLTPWHAVQPPGA